VFLAPSKSLPPKPLFVKLASMSADSPENDNEPTKVWLIATLRRLADECQAADQLPRGQEKAARIKSVADELREMEHRFRTGPKFPLK
jgi:hypothetical protein